jgi:hypothetical protein
MEDESDFKVIGQNVMFILCKQKEDTAFAACRKTKKATTPAKKETCDKAVNELRSCLMAQRLLYVFTM